MEKGQKKIEIVNSYKNVYVIEIKNILHFISKLAKIEICFFLPEKLSR